MVLYKLATTITVKPPPGRRQGFEDGSRTIMNRKIVAVFGSIYVANQVVDSPTSLLPPYFEEKDLHRVLPDGKIHTGLREQFIAPGGASNFSDFKPSGR